MIRLITLGSARLDCDPQSDACASAQQPKRLALLAYLAIARPRHAHRRDTMLGLFWPELDHDRARSALRQALHAIRKVGGAGLIQSTGNESVALDPSLLACDVWELEAAAASGNHRRALELYQGELLAGLYLDDAPEFEQWLDAQRAVLRTLVRDCAWAEAERARAANVPKDVERAVRMAISLSELDEGAAQRAMELLSTVGLRTTALALYAEFATKLREEVDAEPSRALRESANALRLDDGGELTQSPGVTTGAGFPRAASAPDAVVRSPVPSPAPRWRVALGRRHAAAAVLVAGAAIAFAAQRAPSATAPLDPRRVAVAEFVDETEGAGNGDLARAASLAARESLLRVDGVRLVASEDAPRGSGSGGREAGDRAMDPPGTLVRGLVRAAGDSVEVRAEVLDRASGAVARTVVVRGSASLPNDESARLVASFADRLNAAVATALYPGWGTSLSQPASYSGYRLFLDGMRRVKLEEHEAAATSFQRAFDEDSTFSTAGLLAAMEYYQMRRFAKADSLARAMHSRRATLPAIDGHLADWLRSSLDGNHIAARGSMSAVVALAPSADLALLQLAVDNVETARPREALDVLSRIDPAAAFGESWVSYWATRLEALHDLGDHATELTTVREALRRHAEMRTLVGYEARALAALGRVAELERLIASIEVAPATLALDPRMVMRQAAVELAAHGNGAAARRLLSRTIAWYESRPPAERTMPVHQFGFARTLYLADDRPRAKAEMQALLEAYPTCLDCLGMFGVLNARAGDRTAADSVITALEAAGRPFLFGRNRLWMSRIVATLGDAGKAASLLTAAFTEGMEFDVMTHADPDLRQIKPDSVYRTFARVY